MRVDLKELDDDGDGVHWTLQRSADLNANLVRLDPGGRIADHVNSEVDVLIVGVSGAGQVVLDGERFGLEAGVLVFAGRGARRSIESGPEGLSYLTVHRRRGGVTIRGTGG